jgi:hypothetical protein
VVSRALGRALLQLGSPRGRRLGDHSGTYLIIPPMLFK